MHAHIPHIHLPHPHIDLRRLGRDAVIAAELGLAATLLTTSASRVSGSRDQHGSASTPPPSTAAVVGSVQASIAPLSVEVAPSSGAAAILTVRGVDPAAASYVSLYDEASRELRHNADLTGELRIDDVAPGRYYLVVISEGPIVRRDDVATSSAIAVRSPSFALDAAGSVTVRLGE